MEIRSGLGIKDCVGLKEWVERSFWKKRKKVGRWTHSRRKNLQSIIFSSYSLAARNSAGSFALRIQPQTGDLGALANTTGFGSHHLSLLQVKHSFKSLYWTDWWPSRIYSLPNSQNHEYCLTAKRMNINVYSRRCD